MAEPENPSPQNPSESTPAAGSNPAPGESGVPATPAAAQPAAPAEATTTPEAKPPAPAPKPAATAPAASTPEPSEPAGTPAAPAAKPDATSPAPAAAKPAAPEAATAGTTPAAKPAPPAAKPATPADKPAAAAKPPAPKPPAEMAIEPWDDDLTAALAQRFATRIERFATYLGQKFLIAAPESVFEIVDTLRLDYEFDYMVDLTAVDFPTRPKRFELVYILYSFERNDRVRIKCSIAEGDRPESVCAVHPTANWLEREVYDMFGIEFAHHPDLKRLLLPDEWEGFPLRRDVDILAMDNRWVQENLGIESGQ